MRLSSGGSTNDRMAQTTETPHRYDVKTTFFEITKYSQREQFASGSAKPRGSISAPCPVRCASACRTLNARPWMSKGLCRNGAVALSIAFIVAASSAQPKARSVGQVLDLPFPAESLRSPREIRDRVFRPFLTTQRVRKGGL